MGALWLQTQGFEALSNSLRQLSTSRWAAANVERVPRGGEFTDTARVAAYDEAPKRAFKNGPEASSPVRPSTRP